MSEYVIYTDKNEDFECTVDITGASLRGSMARLILEMDDLKIVFDGKIFGSKCTIPIRRMPNILEEGMTGKMKLEMVLDDTYFTPWSSDFSVKSSKRVDVSVNENTEEAIEQKKPKVEVKTVVQEKKSISDEIRNNITANLSKRESNQETKKEVLHKSYMKGVGYKRSMVESAATKLSFELLANDINDKNIGKNKKQVKEIFDKFFKKNSDLLDCRERVIRTTVQLLIDEK